jgi:two-component system OmpR family response regulator
LKFPAYPFSVTPSREQPRERHPLLIRAPGALTEMRVLIIEDDKQTLAYLKRGLEEAGHTVDHAADGKDGMYLALESHYDAAVIDRMLPGTDGLSIVRAMRASNDDTPVLILSALGEVDDRIKGLRAGGDDYLVKPFSFAELLARLDALTRRRDADSPSTMLNVDDLEIDLLSRTVKRADKAINLQPREFRLLEYLMRHADQVVTRTMLLEGVWDYNFDPQTNVIDVHISRLRSKIYRDFDKPLIHTVRGAGYMLSGKACS